MGKALLVASKSNAAISSGQETNLFGYSAANATEANLQASCTEAATFSALGANIIAGNSGTATIRFRDAGANGNNVIAITGVAAGEDTTHTDVLAAADLFNLAYTDTGTNSTPAWLKANVEFTSGHGNFHGRMDGDGVVHDAESGTRFLALAGNIGADGSTSEAAQAWKVRGYDSFEALQVRVTANARTNTSSFRNRIASANGTLLVEFAASATGLVSDTGPADAITDGQIVCASITLGTGIEDLTVSLVLATLKSTTSKSETFAGRQAGTARTASAVANYIAPGGDIVSLTALTEAQARVKVGFAAVVSNLRCYLSANTYASNGTLKLYQNGVAVITTTLTASGGAAWYENASDTITIDADDELSLEFDEGGASGSATITLAGLTFAPVAGGAAFIKMVGNNFRLAGRGGLAS